VNKIPIIILSGGKGERFVGKSNFPKQLSKVSNEPIIMEIMLYYLKKGFNFFILPLGYKRNFFLKFFKNKKNIKKYKINIIKKNNDEINKKKLNIRLFNAGSNTNKLGRIVKSLRFISDNTKIFGVTYGDIFANIDFKKQLLLLKNKNTSCVLASFKERSPFGHLVINKNYKITKFVEKPVMEKPINIGFYFFKKKIFMNYCFDNKSDLETDFLPMLSKKLHLSSYNHTKVHFTVNTQKDLTDIKNKFLKNKNYFKKL
jgi:NDP-sugar pyrophosphorylase family protein